MREQTESIHLDEEEAEARSGSGSDASLDESAPGDSLARGTGLPAEDQTKIASPSARNRTHPPQAPTDETRPSQRNRPPSRQPAPPARGKESPDERLGAVLGSYRILDVLGKGGMGFVYRAEHTKLGREVALKLLRTDYAKRRDAVSRFFQEARTVNRIRHRNIVDVTDFVELDDGTTFIIMELLRGESLGRWARQGFDLPRALAILVQICDGLSAAHTVGVIHRDLKPDNVIIVPTPDGAELVKLLDFGVAKLVNRDDEDVGLETAAGSVIGTPAYMSPEQAGGMPVDARSDIYSVGAIMYELFCGQPMFRGRSFGEYVRKHLAEHPTRPKATSGGAGMDDRLELAILRAIEKEPSRRFGSIAELRDTLLHLLGTIETRPPGRELFTGDIPSLVPPPVGPVLLGTTPTPLPPMYAPPAAPTMVASAIAPPEYSTGMSSISQLHASAVHRTGPPSRATPWWVWFAGGALAVGLGIGGAVWYAARDPAPAATPEPREPADPGLPAITPAAEHRVVQIRFAATPSAGVYAVGSSTELCTTPCTIDVDLDDGGATTHRDYVMKREGFVDAQVRVPITGDKIDVPSVTLGEIEITEPTPTPIEPVVVRKDPVAGKGKAKGKAKGKDLTDRKPDDKKPDDKKPDDKKPDDKKPDKTKIDRTDTIDPFGGT